MRSQVKLVGSYWTLAGPVEIHGGREWSLSDWRDRCAEAARVGMRGLGLWHADLRHQLTRRSLAEIGSIFVDNGLEVLELPDRLHRRDPRAGLRRPLGCRGALRRAARPG